MPLALRMPACACSALMMRRRSFAFLLRMKCHCCVCSSSTACQHYKRRSRTRAQRWYEFSHRSKKTRSMCVLDITILQQRQRLIKSYAKQFSNYIGSKGVQQVLQQIRNRRFLCVRSLWAGKEKESMPFEFLKQLEQVSVQLSYTCTHVYSTKKPSIATIASLLCLISFSL